MVLYWAFLYWVCTTSKSLELLKSSGVLLSFFIYSCVADHSLMQVHCLRYFCRGQYISSGFWEYCLIVIPCAMLWVSSILSSVSFPSQIKWNKKNPSHTRGHKWPGYTGPGHLAMQRPIQMLHCLNLLLLLILRTSWFDIIESAGIFPLCHDI